MADKPGLAAEFDTRAHALQRLTQEQLWDEPAKFFKVRRAEGGLCDAREAIGFIPWMFGLPEAGRGSEAAWTQFTDPQGFYAPFDMTNAERRHPGFRSHGTWDWFCLDGVKYHGHLLTVIWDKDGWRFSHGPGLAVRAGAN